MLPDPVPRDGERALARWGLLGEGAVPVFTPGARYPLAGLLLALPALEGTGLLEAARQVYGRLKDGFYGLAATLLTLVFLALAGEPRAEGATRVPPAALGRVLGLDRAPEVKTIRRKLGELAAAGKAADLIMALARRHAAARPETLGFLHVDGHARVYYGTRTVQKTHVARLKFPAPATMETWVTGQDGDPVFMVVAEPSESLAGELRRLLPELRAIVGEGRRVTVCFDRGGWSPALFADITGAGFDLLTWRKGPAPDLPADAFTTITCADDRGREHAYDLADTTVALTISDGPRKGQTVSLRQVTRRVPARGGGTRQIHALTSRTDLAAGEVCWRLTSRWREENYFRYARTHFALDALDSHAATPDDPDRLVPNPAKKAAAAQVRRAEILAAAAQAQRDASLAALRNPPPGQPVTITNQMINALDAPVQAACTASWRQPRTPRQPSPPASASARSPRTWSGWKPRSSRSPTPSGWPPTTPKPPWPAPWTAATPAPATKHTPSSAKPSPPPATSSPVTANCSSGSTRSPRPGGPRPWPPSATSSTKPRPATPAPISSCATKSNPTPALHEILSMSGVLDPAQHLNATRPMRVQRSHIDPQPSPAAAQTERRRDRLEAAGSLNRAVGFARPALCGARSPTVGTTTWSCPAGRRPHRHPAPWRVDLLPSPAPTPATSPWTAAGPSRPCHIRAMTSGELRSSASHSKAVETTSGPRRISRSGLSMK